MALTRMITALLVGIGALGAGASPAVAAATWPGYHGDPARTGFDPTERSLQPARMAWGAHLGGAVYGQAVAADGRIFAATENNRVVALDPRSGKVLWSRSLGPALGHGARLAGCGDIDPLGITATPVIDTARHTVYVVGEISDGGSRVHHELEGFATTTGAVVVSDDADPPLPPGESAANLLARAALALGGGRVYVSYGGNSGDCGHYHGWVVGLNETGPPDRVSFEAAPNGQGGGVWESGGGPAIDGAGNVYITTGNSNPGPPAGSPDPVRYAESVVKLAPALGDTALAAFKDPIADGDADLGTGNPVLLPDGDVFSVGKTDVAYILRQGDLSVVATIKDICGSDPDGGPVYDAATTTMFVPCRGGGIQEVDLATNRVGAKLAGANGAPLLIGDNLWAAQYPNGRLTDYDATTGAARQSIPVGSAIPTFTSPSAALGLLLVGTTRGVTAFTGPTPSPPGVPTALAPGRFPAAGTATAGLAAPSALVGGAVLAGGIVIAGGVVVFRRQGRRAANGRRPGPTGGGPQP